MFTPGPWEWLGGSLFGKCDAANDDPGFVIGAQAEHDDDDGSVWVRLGFSERNEEEDKSLIAAAPDLYTALEAIVWANDDAGFLGADLCTNAKAALAKARGQA